jgi:hypothetical protein
MTDDGVWNAIREARGFASDVERRAEERITEVDIRTSNHEAVCAERYRAINLKMNVLLAGVVLLTSADLFGWRAAIGGLLKAVTP